jgi:aminocarboxymuconate-semialdehyde decarboxylase
VASGTVDVHSHLFPRWYLDRLKRRDAVPFVSDTDGRETFFLLEHERPNRGRPLTEVFWEIEPKLAFMDREDIDQTALTMGNPWLDPFDAQEGIRMSDRLNEEFATLSSRTAGRIVGLGVLPNATPDIVASVVRAVGSEPDLLGVVAGSRICGRAFDDPALDPVWEKLADAGVPLFVHPRCGIALEVLDGYGSMLPVAVGFPMETTVALARLLFGGVLHRHPGLHLVAAHGGGAITMMASRIDALWRAAPAFRERVGTLPSETLRSIYVDALLYDPEPIRLAAAVVGTDRLMFGTDHPYDIADPVRNAAAIREAIPPEDHGNVFGNTARGVLDLPGAVG